MSNSLHFIFATLLFSHISRCAADFSSICKNDSTFSFTHKGTTRGCGWIRKQSDDIRQGVCQISDIRSQCKVSCGICCEDDPDYFFVIDDHQRYCPWFGKKPIRINTYCGRKSYDLNGAQVRNVCPKACDNCPSFISLENPAFQIGPAPTPAPRLVSTPVPTPATKPIPSLAPTPALNLPLSPAPTPDPNLSLTPAPRNPRSPNMIPTRAPVFIPDQDSTSNPAPQNNLGSVIDGPPDDRDKKSFPYVAVFTSLGGVLCLSLSIAAFVIWKRRSNDASKRKLKLPRLFRRKG